MATMSVYTEDLMDNSHIQTVLHNLNEQRIQGVLCDVTIVVEDIKFKAHKNVLAASSLYFKSAFSSQEFLFSSHVLEIPELKAEIFAKILHFIYSAKVVIKETEKVKDLVAAGKSLGITFLENLTLQSNRSSVSPYMIPGHLKVEANSAKSEKRSEDSAFLNGPRITNAFSIFETEDSSYLFSPLDLRATFKRASDVEKLQNICPIQNTVCTDTEPAHTLAEHSYAVSSSVHINEEAQSSEHHEVPFQDAGRENSAILTVPALEARGQTCSRLEKLFPPTSVAFLSSRASTPNRVTTQMELTQRPGPFLIATTDPFNMAYADGEALSPHNDKNPLNYIDTSITASATGVTKIYNCDYCPSSFSSRALLNIHLQLHNKHEKPLACRFCNKKFSHLKRLKSHEQVCKSSSSEHGQMLSSESAANGETIDASTSFQPLFCEDNSNSYAANFLSSNTDSSLEPDHDHFVKVVDGKILYVCSVCKRTYVTLSSLRRHANVHSWRRTYPCHYCNKVFALAEYRTKHEIWHTGERRYQCIFCLETFMTYYILKNHQKSFHGIDPRHTMNRKITSAGFKPSLHNFKLYRLLPMKFKRRPYKTYKQVSFENVEKSSQDNQVSISACDVQHSQTSKSTSFSFQNNLVDLTNSNSTYFRQPDCTTKSSCINIESDNSLAARVSAVGFNDNRPINSPLNHMLTYDSKTDSLITESDTSLDSCKRQTTSSTTDLCSAPSVISYGYSATSVIMHSNRVSSVIMHGNTVGSVNKNNKSEVSSNTYQLLEQRSEKSLLQTDEMHKDKAKTENPEEEERSLLYRAEMKPEDWEQPVEAGSSSDTFTDSYDATKTEIYIAKPALPGASVDSQIAPLCQITVKIGNEAVVKRRIAGSKLYYKRQKKSQCHNSTDQEVDQTTRQKKIISRSSNRLCTRSHIKRNDIFCKTAAALRMHQKKHYLSNLDQEESKEYSHTEDLGALNVEQLNTPKVNEMQITEEKYVNTNTVASWINKNERLNSNSIASVQEHTPQKTMAMHKETVDNLNSSVTSIDKNSAVGYICRDIGGQTTKEGNLDYLQGNQHNLSNGVFPYSNSFYKQDVSNNRKKENLVYSIKHNFDEYYCQPVAGTAYENELPVKSEESLPTDLAATGEMCFRLAQFPRTLMCGYFCEDITESSMRFLHSIGRVLYHTGYHSGLFQIFTIGNPTKQEMGIASCHNRIESILQLKLCSQYQYNLRSQLTSFFSQYTELKLLFTTKSADPERIDAKQFRYVVDVMAKPLGHIINSLSKLGVLTE
nr:PREDICTED: zinc finger and BTB domain-containing protein 38 [Latimeria chalumnae]|eukprot:XP_014353114.1 PREDICTED: zinc finger and BTB domain-containing protein 38 [Latimeria chalumnae]